VVMICGVLCRDSRSLDHSVSCWRRLVLSTNESGEEQWKESGIRKVNFIDHEFSDIFFNFDGIQQCC